jgi:hypothetical protein
MAKGNPQLPHHRHAHREPSAAPSLVCELGIVVGLCGGGLLVYSWPDLIVWLGTWGAGLAP